MRNAGTVVLPVALETREELTDALNRSIRRVDYARHPGAWAIIEIPADAVVPSWVPPILLSGMIARGVHDLIIREANHEGFTESLLDAYAHRTWDGDVRIRASEQAVADIENQVDRRRRTAAPTAPPPRPAPTLASEIDAVLAKASPDLATNAALRAEAVADVMALIEAGTR